MTEQPTLAGEARAQGLSEIAARAQVVENAILDLAAKLPALAREMAVLRAALEARV